MEKNIYEMEKEMNIIETDWKWKSGLSERSSTAYIVLHHAAAKTCTAKQIDDWHKSNGWSGIGYHFFVRKDGSIYRGRPMTKTGAHVQGKNSCSIGICAEGDYDKETEMPAAQKKAIKQLICYLKWYYYPSAKIVGHREVGSSDCPGKYYPLAELKNYEVYKNYVSGLMEEIDMKEIESLKAEITRLSEQVQELYTKLNAEIEKLKSPMIYNYIDDNMPKWAHEGVQYCVEHVIITGTGEGLGLDDKDLKNCTMIMRMLKALD